jgi:PqqD family protein of HPr-rel-A system
VLENYLIDFPNKEEVSCRSWHNECVVYNSVSGETHLLDGLGAQLIIFVSEKAFTSTDLLQSIQTISEFEFDLNTEALVLDLIMEYQKLGLLIIKENITA